MRVFWEKGYSATSVDDLVGATGVNRYGLYDVYQSKHGLFLAALKHYHRTVISQAIRELEQPGAGLGAIHAVFERIVRRARSGEAKLGCLLCNTAEEVAPFDTDVEREVAAFQRRLTRVFGRAVAVARKAGELPASADSRELGGYLAGLIQGASYLARSPAGSRAVEDFVRVGLRALG
jgi:TetR/AcrR family transcriptional repressor of nem operon